MADITYIVNQDDPSNIPGFENFSQSDLNLIQQYQINSLFDTNKHFVELYITDLAGNIVESDNNYTSYKLLGTAQSAGKEGASILTIDPIQDSKAYGYDSGGVKLLYHFLNDLYTSDKSTTQFYIAGISPDRTEVQLQNLNLTNEQLLTSTTAIKDRLAAKSYFSEFRLNFGNNDLFIGINIDTLEVGANQTVVVKLYEPLPPTYGEKTTLSIVETISDSIAFEVDALYQLPPETPNTLRPANFNLDISDNQVIPTQYLGYNDLFSYPINNTNSQLYSLVNEKGVELSINHSDYSDFVHFSSAYERLINFKYKLQLIENYSSSLALIQTATSQSIGITGSVNYYENLITGVVNNFDHYERYLYYESSSYAWPKSNTTQPYLNVSSSNAIAVNWYANQLAVANRYDLTNGSILINTIPTYIRDDENNQNYLTFVHMIGQHFDNLWIYAKAVTDKYDGDNRLNHGIPKDLVGEALRNFGVKLYTSNNSIEELFGSFIGQGYQSGSEVINTYVTGSITGSGIPTKNVSYDDYNKEVQKRMYHNLPFLLKTKGTERGVRALINCFGIPSDILKIKTYGGRNTNERPFYGDFSYFTGSLDKIRLDNTGSIISGDTLSQYTSNIKRDPKYTDDLHNIEIGFSPTDNIDNLIVSYSLATGSLSSFNIDDYIGDPRNLTSNTYELLDSSANRVSDLGTLMDTIMSGSNSYDIKDYVRLIKFFDNVIFKTVKDFLPARSVVDTGIIIKPHLLQRSKAKSVDVQASEKENLLTGSIDTAFIAGTHGNTFGSRDQYSTAYLETVQTPTGLATTRYHNQQEAKYDGELSGSQLTVTNGQLTADNIYVNEFFNESINTTVYISASLVGCQLNAETATYTVNDTQTYNPTQFFTGIPATGMDYQLTPVSPPGDSYTINPPFTFTSPPFNYYDTFTITATNQNIPECSKTANFRYAECTISAKNLVAEQKNFVDVSSPTTPIDLVLYYFNIDFTKQRREYLQITIVKNYDSETPDTIATITGEATTNFQWNDYADQIDFNDTIQITLTDTVLGFCTANVQLIAADCTLAPLLNMNGLIGNRGQYLRYGTPPFFPDTILRGFAVVALAPGDELEAFQLNNNPDPNPGIGPIHHTQYEYPGEPGTIRDMTQLFPYLTNPNYIFEGFDTGGNQDGSIRQTLPTTSAISGELSDLSGYQLGLASFFTQLQNLAEVSYEIYVFQFPSAFRPLVDPAAKQLVFAATDYTLENDVPQLDGRFNLFDINGDPVPTQGRTGAIKPGTTSLDTTIGLGYISIDGEQVPFWTYNDPAPNEGTNPINGYVAKLNIEALTQAVNFGKTNVSRGMDGSAVATPDVYYIDMYAYTPAPDSILNGQGYTCATNVKMFVEPWIKVYNPPGNPGDQTGPPGPPVGG